MSKSAAHLMHARFGAGEERRVTQEWVQQGWGEYYKAMSQQSFQGAFRDIARQYSAGAYRGTGQLAPTTQQWSAYGWFSDQHWGSGGATLSIAGDYRWYVGQSGRIDVAFEVQSRFYDDYRFRAGGNLLHYSMQSLGQITPFPMVGGWTEHSRWTMDPNDTASRAVPATDLPEPPRLK